MTDPNGQNSRGTGDMAVVPSPEFDPGTFVRLWAEMTVYDTYTGRTIVYSSADPHQADHLFINGEQMPEGAVVQLNAMLPCGETAEFSWEDSVHGNPASWEDQDLFFDVTTVCEVPDPKMVRLTD